MKFDFERKAENSSLERMESITNLTHKERFFKSLIKWGKFGLIAATLFVSKGQFEKREKFNYDLDSISIPDIEIYHHSDPETERILNFLTGKEDFSDLEKLTLIKDADIHWLKISQEIENNKDNQFQIEYLEGLSLEDYRKIFNINVAEIFGSLKDSFDIQKYKTIWKLHKKNGDPKIRFFDYNENEILNESDKSFKSESSGLFRAYYNPFSNTMFLSWKSGAKFDGINSEKILSDWVSELSHAKQFSEKPFYEISNSAVSGIRILFNAFSHGESFHNAQLREYKIDGSVENEAHEVIEPELFKVIGCELFKNYAKQYVLLKTEEEKGKLVARILNEMDNEGFNEKAINQFSDKKYIPIGENYNPYEIEGSKNERDIKIPKGWKGCMFVYNGEVILSDGQTEKIIHAGDRLDFKNDNEADLSFTIKRNNQEEAEFILARKFK